MAEGDMHRKGRVLTKQSEKGFFIQVLHRGAFRWLDTSKIVYLESDENYTRIFCNNETILQGKTIKEFDLTLAHLGFLRVHRNFIANTTFISNLDLEFCFLKSGKKLPMSRRRLKIIRRKKEFTDAFPVLKRQKKLYAYSSEVFKGLANFNTPLKLV